MPGRRAVNGLRELIDVRLEYGANTPTQPPTGTYHANTTTNATVGPVVDEQIPPRYIVFDDLNPTQTYDAYRYEAYQYQDLVRPTLMEQPRLKQKQPTTPKGEFEMDAD